VKAIHDKVNLLLSTLELDITLNILIPHTNILCVIKYQSRQGSEGEEASLLMNKKGRPKKKRKEEGSSRRPPQGRHYRPHLAGTAG
jgi:hypothetical protein